MSGDGNGGGAKERADALRQKLGDDLFLLYPLRVIERRMDRPPADKRGWRPIEDEEDRVYYAYIWLSWRFPICSEYAVELGPDGSIVYGADGEPAPATQEAVAQLLGMKQPNVSSNVQFLVARKLLRVEGRRVYPQLRPPDLTPEERRNYICTDINQPRGEPVIPASFLNFFNKLGQSGVSQDTLAELRREAVAFCEGFNAELAKLRAAKNQNFEKLCTRMERMLNCTNQESPCTSEPEPSTEPDPASTQPPLYKERARGLDLDLKTTATSAGEPAAPESGPAEKAMLLPTTPPIDKAKVHEALREYGTPDGDFAEKVIAGCLRNCPSATTEEIVGFIRREGAAARNNPKIYNPLGLLLKAVPACFLGYNREAHPPPSGGKPKTLMELIAQKKAAGEL